MRESKGGLLGTWMTTFNWHNNVHHNVHEDVKSVYSLCHWSHCCAQMPIDNEQCARGQKVSSLATWCTTLCSNNNVRKQCALGRKKGQLTIFLSTLGCTDARRQWTMCKRIGKLVLAKLLCSLVFPDKVHNHVMALDNPQSQVHAIWLATLWVYTNVHDTVHEDVKPMYSLSYCAHWWAQIVYEKEWCARGCKVGLLATWFTTLWFHNNEHNNSVHENVR